MNRPLPPSPPALALLAALVCAATARASLCSVPLETSRQPPPAAVPESDVERGIRELEAAARKPAPLRPSSGPFTTVAPAKATLTRLMREGTFLVERRGRLIRAANGEHLFMFDADESGRAERPMPMLPCQYLESLLAGAARFASAAEPVAFKVSGQVLAYKARNYLLLTRPADVVRGEKAPAVPTAPADHDAASSGPPSTSGKTSPLTRPTSDAHQIMGDLEAAAPAPLAVVPPAAAMSPQQTTRGTAYREGTFITSRRGRMARSGNGWTLAFDTDPQSPGDAPLHLLPCINLMSMEDLATRAGDSVSMAVSGQVYTFQGRSYLLPTMYVVQPRAAH